MCIGIIRNNSLVGGRTRHRVEPRQLSASLTLYCTWWPSALATRPRRQVLYAYRVVYTAGRQVRETIDGRPSIVDDTQSRVQGR